MRLIDADKVPPLSDLSGCAYEGSEYQAYKSGAEYGRGLVDDTPTVDPESLRPTAHWIKEDSFYKDSTVWRCAACKGKFVLHEAEQYLDKEKVYLITVMERKSSKPAAGWMRGTKVGTYRDVLTNRGYGWHSTDEAHSEQAFEHECWYIPDGSLLFD